MKLHIKYVYTAIKTFKRAKIKTNLAKKDILETIFTIYTKKTLQIEILKNIFIKILILKQKNRSLYLETNNMNMN